VIYSALCSISAKPQYRNLIWKDSLFKWTVGLANSKTACTNDVWYYTPSNCGKYRAPSAMGDLEGYLSKVRMSSHVFVLDFSLMNNVAISGEAIQASRPTL
jgi:hypothetical protein